METHADRETEREGKGWCGGRDTGKESIQTQIDRDNDTSQCHASTHHANINNPLSWQLVTEAAAGVVTLFTSDRCI